MINKTKRVVLDMITVLNIRFRLDVGKVVFLFLVSACVLYFIIMSNKSMIKAGVPKASEGLKIKGKNFTLERKPFRILSGALHYFRIPQQLWSDRLEKAKAMGLNTIETYVPWNLHQPDPTNFDFSGILDLNGFLHTVKASGLYAILRPGPYVCTEWDLGGLPSWLLRDKNMKLRSSYGPFLKAVDVYLKKLSEEVKNLQYSHGGPIIAIQIENEYGTYGSDSNYMKTLKQLFEKHEFKELPFVCDNAQGLGNYELDGVLQTVNFQSELSLLEKLESIQPNAPLFVTEFWIGWFDHWGEKHHKVKVDKIAEVLKQILQKGASFNFYMFHGGTNFGFLNGANANSKGGNYKADTTSYDYDAPVSEVGDLTKKFHVLKDVIKKYAPKESLPESVPERDDTAGRVSYGDVLVSGYMTLDDILLEVKNRVKSPNVMPMEELQINNEAGQSYGYILYRCTIPKTGKKLAVHNVRDHTKILVNGEVIFTSQYGGDKVETDIPEIQDKERTLDILVENCGRVNYDLSVNQQRKGILGHVELDGKNLQGWEIYPLEFREQFVSRLKESQKWRSGQPASRKIPAIYKANLFVHKWPWDTLISFGGWTKGAIFVNDQNLGRYWNRGPQKTLYVPGSWLVKGDNAVYIFEQHEAASSMKLQSVTEPEYTDITYFEI